MKLKDGLSERGRAGRKYGLEVGLRNWLLGSKMGLGRGFEGSKRSLGRAYVVFWSILTGRCDFWDVFGPDKSIPRAAPEPPQEITREISCGICEGFTYFYEIRLREHFGGNFGEGKKLRKSVIFENAIFATHPTRKHQFY